MAKSAGAFGWLLGGLVAAGGLVAYELMGTGRTTPPPASQYPGSQYEDFLSNYPGNVIGVTKDQAKGQPSETFGVSLKGSDSVFWFNQMDGSVHVGA